MSLYLLVLTFFGKSTFKQQLVRKFHIGKAFLIVLAYAYMIYDLIYDMIYIYDVIYDII